MCDCKKPRLCWHLPHCIKVNTPSGLWTESVQCDCGYESSFNNQSSKKQFAERTALMMKTNKGEIMESRFGMSRKVAPSKCPDCNNKLGPINRGIKFDHQYKLVSPSFVKNDTIYRECNCGCVIQWGCDIGPNHYHQVWKRRHALPLFDDKQVIQIVDIFR